jgi:predicted ribosomally synthesized peptide with nif11-like leader
VADPALRERLEGSGSPEAVREVIRAAGYGDVTAEDLKAVVGAEGELSDAELDGVAAAGRWVETAHSIVSPRDAASGLPTGK